MKVFVATTEGQNIRDNDFSWTEEGELVKFPTLECSDEHVDGKCGCRRSMVGFNSLKSTTTFKVAEKQLTKEEYYKLFLQSEEKAGWSKKSVKKSVEELLRLASRFPVGRVLERRGDTVQTREMPKAYAV